MNDFFIGLPAEGWQRLAIDFLWQSSLIGLVGLVLARVAVRRPAWRASIALAATILCVVTPALSAVARSQGWGLLVTSAAEPIALEKFHSSDVLVSQRVLNFAYIPVPIQDAFAKNAALPQQIVEPYSPYNGPLAIFAVVWGLLSLTAVLRLLRDAISLRRLLQESRPCVSDEIRAALGRAVSVLGVRRPLLRQSTTARVPSLVVWGTPRILLPADRYTEVDWFGVFCHELAHLARRDSWSRLAVELVTIVLPWQPLVWLLRREFRSACEEACDDLAISAGADPVEFARSLVDFIPQAGPAFSLGMAESQAFVAGA